jgi:hypothetical protein
MEIELEPDLAHCVQSLAKREYEQVARELLWRGQEDEYLRQKLEMLKLFLESADFPQLRSEYERYLLEAKKVKFKIRSIDGQLEFEWDISELE